MSKFSSLWQAGPGTGLVLAGCLLLGGTLARADTILLRGGERLIGKVVVELPERVSFESQTLGVLEVRRDRIERIERDEPPPPPAANASASVPAASTVAAAETAKSDSIIPVAPAQTPEQKDVTANPPDSIVPLAPGTTAAATPTPVATPPPAAPVVTAPPIAIAPPLATVTEVTVAPRIERVPVAEAPLPPAQGAPTPTTVFYPWSGLGTEQDTFDWIQLKSGEWLKGKLKGMQGFSLDFDSEKLDDRTFDWEDVTIVRSPRMNSMWFGKSSTAAGSLLVTADEVKVISTAGITTYPRADLLAITPTGKHERDNWAGTLSFGYDFRKGNTDEISYNLSATLQRRTPLTRLTLSYLGNFTKLNGDISDDNERITAQFDYFFSRRLYVRVPDYEWYRDPLQNIKARSTLGGAVGYDLFRTKNFEWDVSTGPAFSRTRYISVESGNSDTADAAALVFSTHLDWQATERIEWIFDYRGQASGKESSGGTTQHMNSTVKFEIHKRLKLNMSFIWDRVGQPKTNADGTTPLPDDFRVTTSLEVDL